jgi:hypothetical protein
MRDRHWKNLRAEVQEGFDEKSPTFTLDRVFSLGLIDHTDKISSITGDAKKELRIENGLTEIKRVWEIDASTNLDIEEITLKGSRERGFRIASSDVIIAIIEDHSASLAQFKATRFYKQFDTEIDCWETNIA